MNSKKKLVLEIGRRVGTRGRSRHSTGAPLDGGDPMSPTNAFHTYTRSPNGILEGPYEKPVVVPEGTDQDPARHAWADARFATDIMSEHAEFFALLMPPELVPTQRQQAVEFAVQFADIHREIDAGGPPAPNEVAAF